MGIVQETFNVSGEAALVRCTQFNELTRIFDPDVNAVVLPRSADPQIDSWLAQQAGNSEQERGFRVRVNAGDSVSPYLFHKQDAGSAALREDIRALAELLCDLIDTPRAGVRLEVMHKAMCPRFHTDQVGIRLLCTYRGPGTEYLDQAAGHDVINGVRNEPEEGAIVHVPPYAILLLKGANWQGNAGHGAIHRSPALDAGQAPRVLLAIDGIRD